VDHKTKIRRKKTLLPIIMVGSIIWLWVHHMFKVYFFVIGLMHWSITQNNPNDSNNNNNNKS
jgi:hypothetical protein